ncbi:hypothetical protein CC78DRAFT_222356 [Lojkania enalia]|uniref:Ubiquitin 3 binding protein But2 C-terminal domain-containing protein n=1 Tax=Lojkania enalia TaxID=147567 RepID=A0A9P4KEA2_9PLEO|nr:hypothetical protein CC78DRAFT_222356 [Didymosphaeria enalia]
MKSSANIVTAILAFAFHTSASPVPGKAYEHPNSFIPIAQSHYHGYGGKIEYGQSTGLIQRIQGGNDDISTLLTFETPAAAAGLTCQLNFELDDADYSLSGSNPYFDVFTTSQVATGNSAGWGPPSNYRYIQVGRMKAVKGGQAVPEWGNFQFPCGESGAMKGFELVPTGDSSEIKWTVNSDGPWINYW